MVVDEELYARLQRYAAIKRGFLIRWLVKVTALFRHDPKDRFFSK